jgi:very-short-patch-repair endonuclease
MKITKGLDALARAHDGVLTKKEWQAAGNTVASWYRHQGGLLISCGPNVARLAGSAKTPEQKIRAAVLAAKGTVASHRSAAYLWGIEIIGDDPVDLITATRNQGPALEGVRIHRPRDLDELRGVPRRGIPTTNPTRTLIDLGAVAPGSVDSALEQLLIAGTITVAGVTRTLFDHRQRGRNGVTALRLAVEQLTLGNKPPDSVLEVAIAQLFGRAGIEGWIFHQHVAGFELDFAFPDERVDVEVDGWATHGRRQSFESDRERDAELGAAGWQVCRFTWRAVTRKPNWVAATVAATLAARRQQSGC